ncbi:MAG: acetylxylan esterase [Streptococcaceae bacterium]|nr:acetylxylan esterase [Streptococcaceae bacterium]
MENSQEWQDYSGMAQKPEDFDNFWDSKLAQI